MHVMVGADEKKLQTISNALQQRIDYINGVYKPGQTKTAANTPRPSLDAIFGVNK